MSVTGRLRVRQELAGAADAQFSRIVDEIGAGVLLEEAGKGRLRHPGDRGRLRHSDRPREIVDDIGDDVMHDAERLLVEGRGIVRGSEDLLLRRARKQIDELKKQRKPLKSARRADAPHKIGAVSARRRRRTRSPSGRRSGTAQDRQARERRPPASATIRGRTESPCPALRSPRRA